MTTPPGYALLEGPGLLGGRAIHASLVGSRWATSSEGGNKPLSFHRQQMEKACWDHYFDAMNTVECVRLAEAKMKAKAAK